MQKLSVTAEPADWKENRITFAYTADTSARPLTNNVQEWKGYDIYANSVVAIATRTFAPEAKSKK